MFYVIAKGNLCLSPKYYTITCNSCTDSCFVFFPLGDRVSLCSPVCTRMHVDQTDVELTAPPASSSQVLEFKMLHRCSFYLVIRKSCEIWFAFAVFKKKTWASKIVFFIVRDGIPFPQSTLLLTCVQTGCFFISNLVTGVRKYHKSISLLSFLHVISYSMGKIGFCFKCILEMKLLAKVA